MYFLSGRKLKCWNYFRFVFLCHFRYGIGIGIWSSSPKSCSHRSWSGYFHFRRNFYLQLSNYFRSGMHFRYFGGSSALRCMRPKDHGAGRLNATNVGRACRYGRRHSLSGRRHRNRLASGSLAIYVTLRMLQYFYFRSVTTMAM